MTALSKHRLRRIARHVVIVFAALFAVSGPIAAEEPTSARLNAVIDQEVERMRLPPRSVELTSDKAVHARHAIEQGDFATAHKIFDEVLGASKIDNWRFFPFDDFIEHISDVTSPSFKDRLDEWVAAAGTDAVPPLVRTQYYLDRAWFKRGTKFAQYSDHLQDFRQSLDKGLTDIDASIKLDSSNPYCFYLKLRILAGKGASLKVMEAFKEGIAKYPDYYPLYDNALYFYQPKWGGSALLMYSFVDQYAGHAPEFSPLKLLYVALYRDLLDAASSSCLASGADIGRGRQCVKTAVQQIVTQELRNEVTSAIKLYDHADHYEFGAALQHIFVAMLHFHNVEDYTEELFQQMAAAMPKENIFGNYTIDRAAFAYWYYTRHYEEASVKASNVLGDVSQTKFSSDEKKLIAISKSYSDLAAAADKLQKYEDVIKFESVARRVAGPNDFGHLACAAYHQLQLNEGVVRSCTQAIEDRPNTVSTRYWRGLAYQALQQPDAALADLKIVAESEDDLRGPAALTISAIYLDRGEIQIALDVLNQYPYLFGDDYVKREIAAAAFYARCNIFTQLGDTMKALADCSMSLHYDNRPDVAAKHQELLKRIWATKGREL
jgi:tetratricopeptide (TPR) repeat protein